MNELKNILIVRTDRIGDVVLTLPIAGIIKSHYPNCHVSFLVREYTSPLLFEHPSIDDVFILKEKNGKILKNKNIKLLTNKNFDTVFIVNATFELAWILYKSKIKNRIGTGYRWYSFLFNKKVFVHRKSGDKHELEYNIEMLEKIGINENITPDNVCFNIQIDNDSKQKISSLLDINRFENEKIRIIVHPGSGGSAFDLPKEKIKNLVERLAHELNVQIIITGNENEKELCNYISGNIETIDLCGKLNLKEMIALIDSSDILVANSTGPIHIGAALNKFVVGFYPTIHSMSKDRWGPYTRKRKIFEPENCNELSTEEFLEKDCMNRIDINEVFNSIQNIITNIGNN